MKLTYSDDGTRVLGEKPRLFKHSWANWETASKDVQKNIKSAQAKALSLPPYDINLVSAFSRVDYLSLISSVSPRSNPGPYTLPNQFTMRPLSEEEKLEALKYPKFIRISFTDPERPWSSVRLEIAAYDNWKYDLEGLLSKPEQHLIYPIMIPTKVRPLAKLFHSSDGFPFL